MNEKTKKLNLYKHLGATLISQGRTFLKKAFKVKITKTISMVELLAFTDSIGIARNKIFCADRKYVMIDISRMREIIKYDFGDKKKYLAAVHDCDDFANAFKANVSETYGINSVALARSFQVKIGSRTVWHRCCMFLATDKGKLKAYLLETQNDNLCEITEQKDIQMGNWTYLLGKHERYDF